MTKISLTELNRAFNKLAASANVKSYAIKRELDTEGGFDQLLADFVLTFEMLVNCVDPEQIIFDDGNKSYIFSEYVQPLNSMMGKLISAGPITLGTKCSSKFWEMNISVPDISFDNDVYDCNTEKRTVKGKVLSPKRWRTLLETLSEKFKLNYSFEQASINPMPIASIPGTFSLDGERFYVWNDNVAVNTEFLYFLNYKSVLADGKFGAIEKIHDIDFSTFITGKGE